MISTTKLPILLVIVFAISSALAGSGTSGSATNGPISLDFQDVTEGEKIIQVDSITVSSPFIEGTEVEFVLKGSALSDISTSTLHFQVFMGNIKIFYNDRPAVDTYSQGSPVEFTTTYSIPSIIDEGKYSGMITIADSSSQEIGSYRFPIVFIQPPSTSGSETGSQKGLKQGVKENQGAIF